jgi:hypothetical protein
MIETKHWLVEGRNEWKQLFGGYNWYNITIITLYLENDVMTYGYELVFTLLGLGIRIRYNTDKALKQFEKWESEVDATVTEYDSKNTKTK